jgi:hypothetical protein
MKDTRGTIQGSIRQHQEKSSAAAQGRRESGRNIESSAHIQDQKNRHVGEKNYISFQCHIPLLIKKIMLHCYKNFIKKERRY